MTKIKGQNIIHTVMKCLCGVGLAGSSLYGNSMCVPMKLKRVSTNKPATVTKNDFGLRSNPTRGIYLG